MASTKIGRSTVVADPPLARFLFSDTRMAPVWLLVRIYVGWAWLEAGWHKVQDVGATSNYIIDGAGILAFWNRIAAIPAAPAKPVITYDWYRGFIQFLAWKTAGYIGLDRFLMPLLGTPWRAPNVKAHVVNRVAVTL